MAQHDYVIANQSGSSFRADLNNALLAIASQNSGSSAPSTTYAYQSWADTSAGVMKMRNGANSAWITLYQLDGEWTTLALENGTAAAPSLYFRASGVDTGIYSPGTDQIGISTAGTERLRVDSAGRLGLGTSSPGEQFDISGGAIRLNATNGIYKANADGYVYLSGGTGATSGGGVFAFAESHSTNANEIHFRNSGNQTRAVIDSSGRFLIGATSAAASEFFNVTGSVADYHARLLNSNASPSGIFVSYTGATPNGTGNEFIRFDDTGGLRASVRSNGGIANYSANDVNLSDINTKKDIAPAADTWDCLKEWEIVNFRYKDQPDDADLNMGVIAQQVAESCPEVITVFQEAKEATETEPAQEERLGVKEQQMMWMAIKALQEAQLRIETLEAKVAALEAN